MIKTVTQPQLPIQKPPIKFEPQNQEIPKAEKCGWGQDCPFHKKEEEEWDGNQQDQFQQMYSFQDQNMKLTIPQTSQPTWEQSFNVPDKYVEQTHLRKEWEKKMERLNEKYNFDCFSSLELDPFR